MASLPYPNPPRLDLTDEFHGHRVADPYRYLEDREDERTQKWLLAQDELVEDYLSRLPGRAGLRERVRELVGTGTVTAPTWRGERQFFLRRTPEQEHAVLHTVDPDGTERALIDPMVIDPSGTTTLDACQPDREGRFLAYQLSEGGTEESVLRVLDVQTGSILDGPIDRCRYSPIAWLPAGPRGERAFYYVRRLPPEDVPEGEEQYHRRVYLHRVGTPTSEDDLVFGAGRDKTDFFHVSVSRDGRWLTVSAAPGTAPRNDAWIADLSTSSPGSPQLRVVQEGADARAGLRVGRDGRLYVLTDRDAPRGRLCVTDPADPGYATWRDLVPEDGEAVLEGFAILDGAELRRPVLLADWTRHAVSEITIHDLASGQRIGDVPIGGLGSVGGIAERPEGGHEAWFGYTDHTTPAAVFRYDARTGETTRWAEAPGTVELPAIDVRQVTYTSADGTAVRMFVVSRPDAAPAGDYAAGRAPDGGGPRPAMLYGYGGFGISLTPAYAGSMLAWVEAGGIYAVANLRGGGEEGEEWHRAGTFSRKQNVFDDFHAAADSLIADGWTTPGQLAINGGSNGGLLVGAALTQRPQRYAAVVCAAPLLDMVRYEHSGLGALWNVEYGTADDPEQLRWLLAYSPYHHVREGIDYPATLFTVFDGDTRVDPMHARKMCAALQHATAGDRPVLLRRESDVGHGARAVSRAVDLAVDKLVFLAQNTQLRLGL